MGLTSYEFNRHMDLVIRTGWKAFPFGVQPDLEERWLRSNHGPGFHIFEDKSAADAYLKGVGFGTVRQVQYQRMLLVGMEGDHPALTAEYIFIEKAAVVAVVDATATSDTSDTTATSDTTSRHTQHVATGLLC